MGIIMRRIPKAGELYRHFKGNLYQIVTIATHSETGEILVIYQALYGDFKVYARPLEMFISIVDSEKYPDGEQKFRFEFMEREELNVTDSVSKTECQVSTSECNTDTSECKVNQDILLFLDAQTSNEKLEVMRQLKKRINERLLDDMAVSLDIILDEGTLEEKYETISNCLQTKAKFEVSRFR